jgi:hypothetical protein
MRRSSDRAQVEPIPALVAVAVVSAALVTYAGVVGDVRPATGDPSVAASTLERCRNALSSFGVLRPERLDAATGRAPSGWRINVTLSADGRRWSDGDAPPARAETASELASVAVNGRPRVGRLRVVVWR